LPEPTREELLEEIKTLKRQLARQAPANLAETVRVSPAEAERQAFIQPTSVQPATGQPRVSPAVGINPTQPFGRPVRPHAEPHDTPGHQTTITETPEQTIINTVNVPPTAEQFPQRVKVPQALVARIGRAASPEEIAEQIKGLKSIIISGVDSAGYGDKRTEFRSLAELRQILSGLEEELEDLLGRGGRMRQIRMTTAWDKGL
jgi:hypothetical protein